MDDIVKSIIFKVGDSNYRYLDIKLVNKNGKKEVFLLGGLSHLSRHTDGTIHHKINRKKGQEKPGHKSKLPPRISLDNITDEYYELLLMTASGPIPTKDISIISRTGRIPPGQQESFDFSEYANSQFNIWIALAKKREIILRRITDDKIIQSAKKVRTEFCECDSFIVAVTIGIVNLEDMKKAVN